MLIVHFDKPIRTPSNGQATSFAVGEDACIAIEAMPEGVRVTWEIKTKPKATRRTALVTPVGVVYDYG